MRLLCCGDRNWTNITLIRTEIEKHIPIEVIIHGNARGADKLSGAIAEILGIPVDKYTADWARFGRAAGPIRNAEMLRVGKPTHILAFHNNIKESRGTADMIRKAEIVGIPVTLITEY